MPLIRTSPRDRILGSMAQVLARDGYGGSKVADIARGAHLSLRTFYEEYSNKEECFLELHQRITAGMVQALEARADFSGDWRQEMHDGFSAYFQLVTGSPRLSVAVMIESMTISDASRAVELEARQAFCDLTSRLVERGRAANPQIPSRPLTPVMAHTIVGALVDLATLGVREQNPPTLEELVETATDLLWSVVTNVD